MEIVSNRKGFIHSVEAFTLIGVLAILATIGALSLKSYDSNSESVDDGTKVGREIMATFSGTSVSETSCSKAAGIIADAYGDVALFEAAASYASIKEFRSHDAVLSATAAIPGGHWCLLKFSGSGTGSSETVVPVEPGGRYGNADAERVVYGLKEIARRAAYSVSHVKSLTGTVWTPRNAPAK